MENRMSVGSEFLQMCSTKKKDEFITKDPLPSFVLQRQLQDRIYGNSCQ